MITERFSGLAAVEQGEDDTTDRDRVREQPVGDPRPVEGGHEGELGSSASRARDGALFAAAQPHVDDRGDEEAEEKGGQRSPRGGGAERNSQGGDEQERNPHDRADHGERQQNRDDGDDQADDDEHGAKLMCEEPGENPDGACDEQGSHAAKVPTAGPLGDGMALALSPEIGEAAAYGVVHDGAADSQSEGGP